MTGLVDALRRALVIAGKELRLFFQDKGQLLVLLGLPLLMASLFGSINNQSAGGGAPQLPVYLVNEDQGRYGAQLAETIGRIEVLRVQELGSTEEADRLVARGERLAAIVIPADFSARIDAYEQAKVVVIADPAQGQYGGLVTGVMKQAAAPIELQGEISYGVRKTLTEAGFFDEADPAQQRAAEAQNLGVIMTQLQAMAANPQIGVVSGDKEGLVSLAPDNWFSLTIPMFAVFFAFFLVGTVSSALLKEREEGTLRRLLAAPMHRGSVIGGNVLAYGLLVVLQVGVLFAVGNAFFGMSLGDSPLGLLLLTMALAAATVSLGMVVAALARSHRQADSVGMIMGFLLGGLGGSIQVGLVPLYRSEGLLGVVSRLTPNAHALEGYRRLMVEGAAAAQVLPQVAVLLGMAAVFFVFALWRFRFE